MGNYFFQKFHSEQWSTWTLGIERSLVLGLEDTETEMKKAVDKVDTNKFGKIDPEEFITETKSEKQMKLNGGNGVNRNR